MRKSKFDKKVERSIIKALDGLSRKHGTDEVKHGAAKWLNV